MRCPSLSELLPPPPGKNGWPWTEKSPQAPQAPNDGQTWPRITVVTPSYNQGQFIEETMRSVLLQGYPNLEYMVLDGGSTDNSPSIIRKYAPWLTYWIIEPDNGQADAIARGFRRATGDILAWLNSDDLYMPQTLSNVARAFLAHTQAAIVYGNTYRINLDGDIIAERRQTPFSRSGYLYGGMDLDQPGVFWTRDIYKRVGGVDSNLRFKMDTDLFYRFVLDGANFVYAKEFLACFREHGATKSSTMKDVQMEETVLLTAKYWRISPGSWRIRLLRGGARLRRIAYYLWQGDAPWLFRVIWSRMGFS